MMFLKGIHEKKVYPEIQPLVPTSSLLKKRSRGRYLASAPYCTQTKMNTVAILYRNIH
jgi:hypothetical protein